MRIFTIGLLLVATQSWAAKYEIDPTHTQVGFEVSHMMVSSVPGRFDKFEGSFDFDEKSGKLTGLTAKIDTASINTNNKDRDDHLRNPEFFDVKKFPTIEFTEVDSTVTGGKPVKAKGKLTIHGKTEEVTLDLKHRGPVVDPWGKTRLGFEAKTTVDRKKFGLVWNKNLDAGGVALGDTVDILIKGEATQAGAPTPAATADTKSAPAKDAVKEGKKK
jgi:polyisoprenoid-binding protein YceI